jgi:hypothetical protein
MHACASGGGAVKSWGKNSIDIIPLQRRKDDVAKATTTSRNDPKNTRAKLGNDGGHILELILRTNSKTDIAGAIS